MPAILVIAQTVYMRDPRVRRATLALTQAGYSVDVISQAGEPKASIRTGNADGACLYFLPVDRRRGRKGRYLFEYAAFLLAALGLAAQLYMRRRYEIVYVHTMPDLLVFAALVPKLFGARVLLDVHDPFPENLQEKLGLSGRHPIVRTGLVAERVSIRFADKVITVNDIMKRLLARSIPSDEITVVMNLSPADHFVQIHEQLPADRFIIVYTGTVAKMYGLDLALDALHYVRQSVPEVLLRIVGEGPDLAHLRARVAAEGLETLVEFVGTLPTDQVPRVLATAHCGICPMTGKLCDLAFPNKIYEYVVAGLPAVIPRTALLATYYPERSVLFYRQNDAAEFALRLIEVHRGGAALREQLREGRNEVLRTLNWIAQERVLLECVASLLESSGPRLTTLAKQR